MLLLSPALLAVSTPPHIIMMLGDEVGYNNVGWHSNITISPNLKALAAAGITLERHYVQVSISSLLPYL